MKKLIGTVAVAALLASAAFAELSVSSWLRQVWSPVAYNGDDVMTGMQNSWGGGRTAGFGLKWVGDDEKAGMEISFVYDPWGRDAYKVTLDDDGDGTVSKNDDPVSYGDAAANALINTDGNRLIWVKPWDFLKLSFGHWDGINDIQSVNTASWDWIRPWNWLGNLYCENQATGALFEITPVDDLMIRVGLPFVNPDLSYHMFEALTVDVEYTITDLLGIKVGWRGGAYGHNRLTGIDPDDVYKTYKYDGSYVNVGEIDVLLQLLAVENLQLDVGARINLLNGSKLKDVFDEDDLFDEDDNFVGGGVASSLIGIKAGYAINDKFTVKADFAIQTWKKIAELKHKPDFAFGVGVGVALTDSLSLDADFRAKLNGDYDYDGVSFDGGDPTFSFLVGLQYACSTNASVGIGFQGLTNGGKFGPLSKNGDNFGFAVPIRMSVNF